MTTFASKRCRIVLDTDTFNEVDDQFALAHLLLSPDQVDLEAVYAAPFFNSRSSGPAEGMEKSYEEIHRVLDLVLSEKRPAVFRGSTAYLPDAVTPVMSEMIADLVERALAPGKDLLHVVAIGAITNIASALLAEPRIASKIKVIWLGGHAPHWRHTNEFNLRQDLHAARVLLDHEVPLVLVPCNPVASHLSVTVPELEKHLAPYSRLGAYLTDIVRDYGDNHPGWSKVIWDIAASAWILDPGWVPSDEKDSPVLRDDLTWESGKNRRKIHIAYHAYRDAIFSDFYKKTALLK